jgi:hypothetical protein
VDEVLFRRAQATNGAVVDILVNDRPLVELVRDFDALPMPAVRCRLPSLL